MVDTGEILAGLGRHGTAVVIKIPATDGRISARRACCATGTIRSP